MKNSAWINSLQRIVKFCFSNLCENQMNLYFTRYKSYFIHNTCLIKLGLISAQLFVYNLVEMKFLFSCFIVYWISQIWSKKYILVGRILELCELWRCFWPTLMLLQLSKIFFRDMSFLKKVALDFNFHEFFHSSTQYLCFLCRA